MKITIPPGLELIYDGHEWACLNPDCAAVIVSTSPPPDAQLCTSCRETCLEVTL